MKTIPEVKDIVTLSSKTTDRSWTNELWEVVAVNESHAQLKSVKNPAGICGKILVRLDEYTFHDASSFQRA